MKYFRKRILVVGLACMLAVSMIGCTKKPTNQNSNVSLEKEVAEEEVNPYDEDLAKIFKNEKSNVYLYNGTAEYRQSLTITDVEDTKDKITYKLDGKIESNKQDSKEANSVLGYEYIINQGFVLEKITNDVLVHSQSITKEQIILKAPIVKGENWTQKIKVGDKNYDALTTITDIYTDDEGNRMISTEMVVKDIEGYPENIYIEKRVYKDGKGLYRFDNTILLDENAHLEFGYTLYEGL